MLLKKILIMAEQFAMMFNTYLNETSTYKDIIRGCVQIINDGESTNDNVRAAVSTLAECLFPSRDVGKEDL